MSLIYAQKDKSVGVKSGRREGQLIGSPRPGIRSYKTVPTEAQEWADAPSCWELMPSIISTTTAAATAATTSSSMLNN
jgi:hypothetical protein